MTTTRIKFLIGTAIVGGTMTIGAGAQAYWGNPWGGPWSEPGWGGGPRSEPGWGGGPWSEPGWGGGPWSEPGWGGGPWSEPGLGGGPWSEPGYPYRGYSAALDRMHERQSEMREHKTAIQSLGRMLSGRRTFDRAEAIGLAREIEASAGENLAQLFKPGESRGNPLSRARIGDEMETFKANADALKQAAAGLADELEKEPSAEDIRAGRVWFPNWRRSSWGGLGGPYSRWTNEGGPVTTEVLDAFGKLQDTCYGCHANFRSPWR